MSQIHAYANTSEPWSDGKVTALHSIVILSGSFSVIGTSLIFCSYAFFPELRTNVRKLLVYLSLCDFITALGNAIGVVLRMVGQDITKEGCIVQSFFTTYSSMGSFMWTIAIAVYLYLAVSRLRSATKVSIRLFHVVCWGVPLLIMVAAVCFGALGSSRYSGTVGWCWIVDKPRYGTLVMWQVIAGKGIEISSYILTPVLYFLTKRRLPKRSTSPSELHTIKARASNIAVGADRKMILVPLVFVLLRMWGTLRWVLETVAPHVHVDKWYWLAVFQGFGDSGQGWANALLFVIFTAKVRNKMFTCGKVRPAYGEIQ